MPRSVSGSPSAPSFHSGTSQNLGEARPSQPTPAHEPTPQMSAEEQRARAIKSRQRAIAGLTWLGKQTKSEPVMRLYSGELIQYVQGSEGAEGTIRSMNLDGTKAAKETPDFPAHIEAQLNQLIGEGRIQPGADELAQSRSSNLAHDHEAQFDEQLEHEAGQRMMHMRFQDRESDLVLLHRHAEMQVQREEDMRNANAASSTHPAFLKEGRKRLEKLDPPLIGLNPAQAEEYKKNCSDLQNALEIKIREAGIQGIDEKTYQTYSEVLTLLIRHMPSEINQKREALASQDRLRIRLNELMRHGNIEPSHEEFEEAEDDPDYDPYVSIAHDHLDGLSNPPVGTDPTKRLTYISDCNDLKRALAQEHGKGRIDAKTYDAYATALKIRTENMNEEIEERSRAAGIEMDIDSDDSDIASESDMDIDIH